MPNGGRARDVYLLDSLDALERSPFEGTVWRVVRAGRDPLQGHASAGRWDPGTFDVLYTSLEADGAEAEMSFQLSRQPVYPSGLRFRLHEIAVAARKTLRFAHMRALASLGIKQARYADVAYVRTQEIGDAAFFLGFDGLVAPSARWPCLNLVIFTERLGSADLRLVKSEPVDLVAWRSRAQPKGGSAAPVQLTSNRPAAPMPPPMHMVTTTFLAPRRLPSIRAWPTRRAPLMP